jgi:hypothetical protein
MMQDFLDLELTALSCLADDVEHRRGVLLRAQGRIAAGEPLASVEDAVREEIGPLLVDARCRCCGEHAMLCPCYP